MRTFFAASCLVASAALADLPNGVWTGYVNGWVPNSNAPVTRVGGGFSDGPPVRRQPWIQPVPYYVFVQPQQPQQQASAEKAEAAVRAAQLEAERQAAVDREQLIQRQLDAERQLAAQRELAAQQQLEAERQLAAQRLALEQQRQQVLAAAVAAAPPPPAPVRAAPKEDAKPYQPGNDVYRWVDDDGVTHYSTNVPDSARARAKKVGGASP